MPEVVDWLKTLGMSEYAERFAESDIDFAILSDLTDQDLEEDRRCIAWPSPKATARNCQSRGYREKRACSCDRGSTTCHAETGRHRRAPPSHGDVLGPRRFDSTLGAHGP